MKTTFHPHGLVIPSQVFLAFRIAAVVRMALAPLYAVAGMGQAVEGTLACFVWTLWIRLCETKYIAGMSWPMNGSALDERGISGIAERDEHRQGAMKSKVVEEVRMMEEGRDSHSYPS